MPEKILSDEELQGLVEKGEAPECIRVSYKRKSKDIPIPVRKAFGVQFKEGDTKEVKLRYENAIDEPMQELGFKLEGVFVTKKTKAERKALAEKVKVMEEQKAKEAEKTLKEEQKLAKEIAKEENK